MLAGGGAAAGAGRGRRRRGRAGRRATRAHTQQRLRQGAGALAQDAALVVSLSLESVKEVFSLLNF